MADAPFKVPNLDEVDRLFLPFGGDIATNACVHFGLTEHGMVNGFRKAADSLVDVLMLTRSDQDYLVFPIAFCYRQYFELRLKGLLRDSSRLLDQPDPPRNVMERHRLVPIWSLLEPKLCAIFQDSVELTLVGDRVREFDEMDPESMAFRFATSKRGGPLLPADLRNLDLANLRDVMSKIAFGLDGADLGVDVYLEQKAEMSAEYGYEIQYEGPGGGLTPVSAALSPAKPSRLSRDL
jgi:hypothetical protein